LQMDAGKVKARWPLGFPLASDARIAVAIEANSDLLFVGPMVDGRVLALDPTIPSRLVPIIVSSGGKDQSMKVQAGSVFWPDFRNRTLIITDAPRHRVIEVDVSSVMSPPPKPLQTNDSTIAKVVGIYGGAPGVSDEGQTLDTLAFQCPSSVVVYRPEGFKLKTFLSNPSKKLIEEDGRRAFPRTIVIADSAANRIHRVVEFAPESGRPPRAYTLVGSGSSPTDQSQEISTAPDDDMRRWAIKSPREIVLSLDGQLCILLDDMFLLLLTPISARRENIEYKLSGDHNWGISW
jgi:hypothetical protein